MYSGGMEVRLKKICKPASVLALLLFNTGCALYLSSYYYDLINKMKYICTPSCMDIIVSCMNEYNIQIVTGTVILLNMYGILGQYDKDVFLLKFGSVRKYKRCINRKIIIQSLFYSTYFFANVLFFAVRSGYVMINWNMSDSYFCLVNHAVSDIRLWTCLLAVYLSLLLNWFLMSVIFFMVYSYTRKKTVSLLIIIFVKYWCMKTFGLCIVPVFEREYAVSGFLMTNIALYAALAAIIYFINWKIGRKRFIALQSNGGLNEHRS